MLHTERLSVEQASLEDREFFYSLLNSPNWLQHIGDRGIKTVQDAEDYIKHSLLKNYTDKGYGLYKVSLKIVDIPIGICGFVKRDYLDSVDIGFAVLPEFEGRGYTYEAAKATIAYGRTQLGFDKMYGVTTEENRVSRHLLEKLGLSFLYRRFDTELQKELLIFLNKK